MREIKFRAWIKEEQIMTYFEDESYILNGDMSVDAFDYDKSDCKNYFEPCYKTVDAEIMQYTELKDKNGKEIYEGDIIDFSYDMFVGNFNTFVAKGIVVFEDGAFYVQCLENERLTKDESYLLYTINIDTIEVIGNIYDNPELLKGEQN